MYNTSRCSGGFQIRAILDRNKIISITCPPRQLQTWEYYCQNRTIKLHFMRCQQQVLEYFPKMWDFFLPQTGLLRSMLRPSDLGPGGRSYNKPISHLQQFVHQVSRGVSNLRLADVLIGIVMIHDTRLGN